MSSRSRESSPSDPTAPEALASAAAARRRKVLIAWAAVFALVGVGVCFWSWTHSNRTLRPQQPLVPVMDFIPRIPQQNQGAVTEMLMAATRLTLALNPEQQEQVRAIWDDPPKSFEDMIRKQKEMDRVLTERQLALLQPMRKAIQDRIVDAMFEAGRDRFTPEEFEQFKGEIKRRVESRMSQP